MNTDTRQTTKRQSAGLIVAGLACLSIAVVLACSESTPGTTSAGDSTPVSVDTHGLHAVRNADLRMIMQKLHALHLEQISEEIEITGDLQRDICEVATMAESLAADAQLMPLLLKNSTMTNEARRLMGTLSSRLRIEADELARAADRNDLPAVRNNLRTMLDTCAACHDEFRPPALASARW